MRFSSDSRKGRNDLSKENSPVRKSSSNEGQSAVMKLSTGKRKLFRIEISYSSTILFIWILTACTLCWLDNQKMQATTMILLTLVALTSDHGESRVLFPLIFLVDGCLENSMQHNNSPVEFYALTMISFLSLQACKEEELKENIARKLRMKICGKDTLILETIFCGSAGIIVIYIIFRDKVFSFGAAAAVAAGHAFFLTLFKGLGENEAILVSSIVGFYIADVFTNNNLSIDGGRESVLIFNTEGNLTTYTHVASRGVILSAIYMILVVFVFSKFCLVPVNKNSKSSEKRVSRKRITVIYWGALFTVNIALYAAISYQFRENAVKWIIGYIISSSFRTWTVIAWIVCIPIGIVIAEFFNGKIKPTIHRKMYHFIAVIALTPAIMIDPPFASLAASTATAIFVLVEIARVYQVYGTRKITAYVQKHIDQRESVHGIVRTHIYLLYGFVVSLIIRYRHLHFPQKPIPAVMELSFNIIPGVLSLGVIDSAAAIIGSSFMLSSRRALGSFLRNKFFTVRANNSIAHKTTTGTLGGFVCGVMFWYLILTIAEVPIFALATMYTFTMVAAATLTECFISGIDNLQLPLVMIAAISHLFALLLRADELWVNEDISRPNPTTASSLAGALTSPWIKKNSN